MENNGSKTLNNSHEILFGKAEKLASAISASLSLFNDKSLTLSLVGPCERILLLFFIRSVKTFNAIRFLCRAGYGQDVAVLLRSLLENLICIKYILSDQDNANEKAVRFVDYKWVVLKRQWSQRSRKQLSDEERPELDFVQRQFEGFKKKYGVISDKALLTWSGKSIRDMAQSVDKALLDEYENNFRMCSRFSHPGILGDDAYVEDSGDTLKFSPMPSYSGLEGPLLSAMNYIKDFLELFVTRFGLSENADDRKVKQEYNKEHPGKEHKDYKLFIRSCVE